MMTVAFIGNPNCGKTTLFNAYTGANLKVANWPGVTVEKVEGSFTFQGEQIRLVDLPGTYSLTSYTMEEQVSRNFILSDEVDVVIDVVDASALERNLYLTLQLLELGKPVVIALNMMDIVEKRGMETESGGRVHTSTATVAVLPEMEPVDVEIRDEDIEMQVFRSSGAGGQHINKTSSAVRLIHKPTGIVVACQEERSQVQNREKCMRMLASKLYEIEQARVTGEITGLRRSQVGTGMRNERIRTYNFPQGRVTDHRIGLTLYKIDAVMNGDLDELIDALATADQAEKLKSAQ